MNADRAVALYLRLRFAFPARWRRRHEAEFLETLREEARDGRTSFVARLADLLGLAFALHRRGLAARCSGRIPSGDPRGDPSGVPGAGVGPLVGVLGLAALLLLPTLRWAADAPPEFIATSVLVVLVPGIGVIYTVSNAVAGGRGPGLLAAFGCTLGIVPHLLVAFLGLSGLMQLGASVFELVRWAGVAYLVWMGVGMLRDRGGLRLASDGERTEGGRVPVGATRVVARGVIVNLLNPKLTAFFFAFLPQFVGAPGSGPSALGAAGAIDPRLLGLGSLFMLITLGGFVFYALAGAAVGRWAGAAPAVLAWTQRVFGALLLGFAARLAVAER